MDIFSFHLKHFYVHRQKCQHEFEQMLYEMAREELRRVKYRFVRKIMPTYSSIVEDAIIAHLFTRVEACALTRKLRDKLITEAAQKITHSL
jgi:hypothetical protein